MDLKKSVIFNQLTQMIAQDVFILHQPGQFSRYSVRLWAGRPRSQCSIPGGEKRIFFSP
jgi:hypothetical protein